MLFPHWKPGNLPGANIWTIDLQNVACKVAFYVSRSSATMFTVAFEPTGYSSFFTVI